MVRVFSIVFFLKYLIVYCQQPSIRLSQETIQDELSYRKETFGKSYIPGKVLVTDSIVPEVLERLDATTNLIIFWKTDCPYCKNLLAVVDGLLQKTTPAQLQVVAYCLDNDTVQWQKHEFVQKQYKHLQNLCDGKGYWGTTAQALSIFATPTMIVLNKNRQYVKLPKNVKELEELIK